MDVARVRATAGISRAASARSRSARSTTGTPRTARSRASASAAASPTQGSAREAGSSGGSTSTGPGVAAAARMRQTAAPVTGRQLGRAADSLRRLPGGARGVRRSTPLLDDDLRRRAHPRVGGELLAEVEAEARVQAVRAVVVAGDGEAGRGQALRAEGLEG